MNKKGFTLIELLSVLVLIGLLMTIAVPGISRINSNINKKTQNTKKNLVEKAAILWGQDNKTRLRNTTCTVDSNTVSCYKVKIKELINTGYLDGDMNSKELVDPVTKVNLVDKDGCVVYVYIKNNRVNAYFDVNQSSCK